MSPLPAKGNRQVDRIFPGVGRIRRSAGTRDEDEFAALNDVLSRLYEDDQLDSLRAFSDGRLSVAELREADRKGRLTDEYLLGRIKLEKSLWDAIDETLPELGESPHTRRRYETSRNKLAKYGGLGERAKVRDLRHVRWKVLKQRWPGQNGRPPCSAADWMHLRRFISTFLTTYLGDVLHPFRRDVMKLIPRAKEEERLAELNVEQFWELVDQMPEFARASCVTLAITGMRLGEYLGCGKEHLYPATAVVHIPGGKTGADRIEVPVEYWPWVERAIPAPLRQRWLREYFQRACLATGLGRLVRDADRAPIDTTDRPTPDQRRVLRALDGGARLARSPGRRRSTFVVQFGPPARAFRARRPIIQAMIGHGWLTDRLGLTATGRDLARRYHYEGLRLHDLRHFYAQLASDAGLATAKIQSGLRHATEAMTRRYEKRRSQREVASAVGNQLARKAREGGNS